MNEVYVIGKIITDIEYKFIINKKEYAIAKFKIELQNKSKVLVKGYDNVADKLLRKFHKGSHIYIRGTINSQLELIVKEVLQF